ncbi:putative WW domain-containing protein [Plasmopara halstedii]
MRIPTSDVIARGVLETLMFMHKAFEELQRSSRRETAEALQDVLAFAASLILMNTSIKRQLASNDDLHIIMSYFEPECDHLAPTPSKELRVYGVVWERFYSDLLPAIERQQALTQTISQQYPQNKAKVDQKPFSHRFSAEEIEDALINYNDAFSTVSMTGDASSGVLVEFRRCACLNSVTSNEKGQSFQKVCLPRENPFNCQRLGRLIRAQMLTMEQAQDQLASSYFRRKVDRLVQKTRCRTIDYVNSAAGMAQFEKSARFLAHEMVSRRHRLRQLLKTFEKAQQHLCSRRNKLCRQIENLKRAKETQVQALRDKWARTENAQKKLQYELENAIAKDKDGAVVAVKSKKIKKLNEKLDVLRIDLEGTGTGDEKMNKIELAIASLDMEEQKLVKVTEKSWALEMEIDLENEEREKEFDVVDDEEDDEEDEDGEEEDEESEDEEEDSNLDVEGNTDEASCSESEEKVKAEGFTSSSSKPFFNINMPKEMVVDYRKTAILAVDKELERLANDENQKKGNKSKTEIITKRPQFTIPHIVSEEKLLELFRTQLRDSYVEMQCAKVSTQVTKEFLQMRAVLQRWRGLNALAVFEAWHQVAHLNRLNAKAFKSSSEQIKILDKQNQELEEEFARMDARLWVQRSDAYTDAIYYENEQTGETSYTPPQYWAEEQQKHVKFDDIPRIKLPLIR